MRRRELISALAAWALCAFVVWNVAFDRQVKIAAHEFTRDQVIAHQRGDPVRRIDDALRPRVRKAACDASLWAGGILAAGGLMTYAAVRVSAR